LVATLLTITLQACGLALQPTYRAALAYDDDPTYWTAEEGVGHFSEWSKDTKRTFIDEVRDGKASEWVIVMGNEGGGKCLRRNTKSS
jgi:hypothetical protein